MTNPSDISRSDISSHSKAARIHHSALWILLLTLMLCLAAPDNIDAARKRSKAKAKTTATSRKKKSKRRRSTSGKSSGNWALTAADINPDSKSPTVKQSKSSKRKVTVTRPDLDEIRKATLDPAGKMYFPKLMEKFNLSLIHI